jgi:RND family efflux transporter MFP subunit
VGQPVTVITENVSGKEFAGKIARFTYALDVASRTMLAEVSLDNPDLLLRPGMLVTAKLGIERRENAALLPSEAVVMEKTNAFVYAVDGQKAAKHAIKVGFNDGKNVEVLDGVKPDDVLIKVGQRSMTDGLPVRVSAQ